MEDFVAAVKVYSQDKNWIELRDYLNDSNGIIAKNASKIDSAILSFDPAEHTIGVIGLMFYKVSLPDAGDFVTLLTQYLSISELGDKSQIQLVLNKFFYIGHVITESLLDQKASIRGIKCLMAAITKVQKHPAELTRLHVNLLQLCLASKCMKPALKVLDIDVTEIHTENDTFDAKDFLLYYYYGGMIYLALKQYEKALFFFQIVLTTPAMVVSHIMLEAYRKFVLVSLFLHGEIIPLPKYTSQVVSRQLKPLSQAYTELVDSYASYNSDQLRSVANKHQAIYQRDDNVGLVKQVISSLTMKRIQKLTKTFLTLSLADMATRVNLRDADEAESYLLQMIEDGTIHATIDQPAGVVSFHNSPERYNTPKMLKSIDEAMQKCLAFTTHLHGMDQELQVNPHYVQKVSNMLQMDDAGKVDEVILNSYG